MALTSTDTSGSVSLKIFDMSPVFAYPAHQLAMVGASLEKVAYDVTLDQAVVVCYSHRSGITCERKHLQSLMEPEMEPISWWFLAIFMVALFWFRSELSLGEKRADRRFGGARSSGRE